MEKKIRVAQVIGSVFLGGVESCVMNYFCALKDPNVEFTFVIDQFSKLVDKDKIEKLGGKVALVPHYTHVFAYRKALKKLFKQEKFDVVHANMSTLNFLPLKSAKKAGIKVRIAHGHATSSPDEKLRNLIKQCLRPLASKYATDLVACSTACGKWLFGNKPFTVIANAIDLKRFVFDAIKRDEVRKEFGFSDNLVLGHVGRFVSVKNHGFLLSVFKEVVSVNPNARLLLVGSGDLKEEIIGKAKELGVFDKVVIAGDQAKVEDCLFAMDCFVFPSFYEGLGLALIEAQATGLRCFASDRVSSEAKISDNLTYLPLGDAKQWASCILDSSFDRVKCNNATYDISKQVKKLVSYYQERV